MKLLNFKQLHRIYLTNSGFFLLYLPQNVTVLEYHIIKGIKNSDEQAFELLFRKYYQRLCGFANKFLNDIPESEEIVQEVFFSIWKNREKLSPKESLKPYLFKSVQNLCLNFIQHQKVVDRSYRIIEIVYENSPHKEFSAYEKLLASELEQKIDDAIKNLPSGCAEIFQLSRNEGLKYSEIAEKLNISVKTVETQISRALKKLRAELKDYLIVVIIAILTSACL
ncbi:RNA polymerase ECF-type sigma factor [hydrothermal vent metagenome]|uniref:RNA polymerase ECF-type sigma factor n=1 Tax=hydrothermal vent metagenome TaxID=652676 RepID=A0A3B0TZB5_9ZZZZ